MNSEKQKPREATPAEVVAAALNEQGFLFQHSVIEELAELKPHGSYPHNWMVEASEVPVSLPNEAETRIDIVLRNQASGESPWYAVLECKRLMREYKRWVFFSKTHRSRPSAGNYYIEHGDLQGSWNGYGVAPMNHRLERRPAPDGHEAFDFYLEVRLNWPGSGKTVSATNAIEDAFQQVTLGQAGLALRMRATNVLKFRLLPVVVTTAELMGASYDATRISLEHGRIEPTDLTLENRRWVAVNYRVNDVICQHSRFTTNRSQEIGVDIAARQVRTVFVVQAAHIHEFLAWLWRKFECED
jgi:hypothetical protein